LKDLCQQNCHFIECCLGTVDGGKFKYNRVVVELEGLRGDNLEYFGQIRTRFCIHPYNWSQVLASFDDNPQSPAAPLQGHLEVDLVGIAGCGSLEERVISEITIDKVVRNGVRHSLRLFLLILAEGRIAPAGNQTAEVVETDHVVLLLLLVALPVVHRKHLNYLQTLLLTDSDHQDLLVKLLELRRRHQRLLVITHHIHDGILLTTHLELEHGTVGTEVFGEVVLDRVEP
jgi:hypothetical protein